MDETINAGESHPRNQVLILPFHGVIYSSGFIDVFHGKLSSTVHFKTLR